MARKPASIVDCAYDGLDTLYVRGKCTDEEAVALAVAYALEDREGRAGAWHKFVGGLDPDVYYSACHHCPHTFTQPRPTAYEGPEWDAYVAAAPPDACPGCGARTEEPVETPRYGVARRTYARWVFAEAGLRDEGYSRMLYTDADPKPGAFPIVILVDLDEREREQARRREREAKVREAEDRIRAKYPEATRVVGHEGGHNGVIVDFDLPGLTRSVSWLSWVPGSINVPRDQLEAFNALYGAKDGEDA